MLNSQSGQESQRHSPVGAPLLALMDNLPPVLTGDVGCSRQNSTISSLVASLRQIERQGRLPSTRWSNQHNITLIPKMRQNLAFHRKPKNSSHQQISFTLNFAEGWAISHMDAQLWPCEQRIIAATSNAIIHLSGILNRLYLKSPMRISWK